jgi:hypothetical protein
MKDIDFEDSKTAPEGEEKNWQWLPDFDLMVYVPELKAPKVELKPRMSSEERWKAIMAKVFKDGDAHV